MGDPNPEPPMDPGAVDTHCHLFLMDGEPAELVRAARVAGVATLICVGVDPDSSRRSVELAESFRGVFATVGMHPHDAAGLDASAGARIEELLDNPHVVGVGETGLDLYRMRSPRADQERALRLHAGWSRESGKPLVVHVRDAWADILRVLDEERVEGVVLHCFTGDADVARACGDRGWFLSFAGNITYPRNGSMREAAAAVPLERLLTETDSPFLAPQSKRGASNAPANVLEVVDAIAGARGEPRDVVLAATAANARAAFAGIR
jgi:TatD DNase family protein